MLNTNAAMGSHDALMCEDSRSSSTAQFTRTYRLRNRETHQSGPRVVEVHASSDEVQRLEEEGFVVRERLLPPALLDELREAADSIEAQELQTREVGQGSFGGLFTRNIVDRHPAFLKLLDYEPLLSVARLTLGPQVQLHGSVLRVSYPDLPGQGVEWHFHQRVVPDPLPSFFFRPVVLDNLIYLDDLTLEAGPLAVLPRTHLKDEDLPSGDNEDKPEQVVVTCPAGSVVTSHSGLWHKAFPTQANGGKRRLIIWGYSPVWMKQIDKPSAGAGYGLTDRLIANANEQTRELLGLSGYY